MAKLRCLRIVFLRTTLFSVSVTKLNFRRSFLLKNFLAYWQLNEVTLSHKSVSAFLCLKYAEFSFIAGKICFGLFAVKLGCFQRYCTGICFLPVCSESLYFYLLLLKTNVSVYFPVSYAVFRIHAWRNSLYLFSYINCAVNPLSYRKHVLDFWQLQWKL